MANNLGGEMDLSALLNVKDKSDFNKDKEEQDDKNDEAYNNRMKKLTSGQIDPEQAKIDKYRHSKRVQIIFSVPEVLKLDFLNQAIKEGFYRTRNGHKEADQKKYFYQVLRRVGIDIPEDEKLDGRRL